MRADAARQQCPKFFVTPDLFRGPLCGAGAAGGSKHPPAARWTPEQVRGDGGRLLAALHNVTFSPGLSSTPDRHPLRRPASVRGTSGRRRYARRPAR
ncbi:hypothetical protein CP552_04530 [Sphingomonas melonis]|nr:hypothetical protein CP552_04530 [Sphingomonas melonis]MBI0532706.1 hypothetical protein [Sphingomonas sp. TX0522]